MSWFPPFLIEEGWGQHRRSVCNCFSEQMVSLVWIKPIRNIYSPEGLWVTALRMAEKRGYFLLWNPSKAFEDSVSGGFFPPKFFALLALVGWRHRVEIPVCPISVQSTQKSQTYLCDSKSHGLTKVHKLDLTSVKEILDTTGEICIQ